MATNPGYFFGEAIGSFRRNWVMSLVAVTIIYISLMLVGTFFLAGNIVNRIATDFEQKVSITIFLKDGAIPADVQTLQANIQKDARVESVQYVSKSQALERFKKSNASSPEIFQQLRGNPLPASFEVKLKDPRQVAAAVATIKKNPALAPVIADPERDVKWGENIAEKLFKATGIVRGFVLMFVIMLLVVSLVLIGNTIRLAIYSRRKEIGIMRLVGASNWFIRTPFLFEGVLQSIIGALLAILTLMIGQWLLVPWLQDNLRFLPVTIDGATLFQLSALLLLSGIGIGLLGSGTAVRRYLKV